MIATTDNRYSLFGGVLRTSLELPELHPVMLGADENWTLTVHDDVPAPSTAFPWSADEELAGGISIRLERAPDGVSRLTYSDTGTFDISRDGTRIDWYRAPNANGDLARTDILGRVISLAMQSSRVLMLHASAVWMNGEVAGFLAPKFYGKSTLACALTDAGARLVTDDALGVRIGDTVACAPGVPAIRLRKGAAAYLRGSEKVESDSVDWRHLERRAAEEVLHQWAPVGALYVLNPRPPREMTAPAIREPLSGTEGALALVKFAKLGNLLRGMLAVEYLEMAAEIANRASIYTLTYARDMERLAEVAETVKGWHRG